MQPAPVASAPPEMSLEEQEELNNSPLAYDYNNFLQNMEYNINQLTLATVATVALRLNTVSTEVALVETETNNLFKKQCQKLNNLIEPNTLNEFLQNMNIFD